VVPRLCEPATVLTCPGRRRSPRCEVLSCHLSPLLPPRTSCSLHRSVSRLLVADHHHSLTLFLSCASSSARPPGTTNPSANPAASRTPRGRRLARLYPLFFWGPLSARAPQRGSPLGFHPCEFCSAADVLGPSKGPLSAQDRLSAVVVGAPAPPSSIPRKGPFYGAPLLSCDACHPVCTAT